MYVREQDSQADTGPKSAAAKSRLLALGYPGVWLQATPVTASGVSAPGLAGQGLGPRTQAARTVHDLAQQD